MPTVRHIHPSKFLNLFFDEDFEFPTIHNPFEHSDYECPIHDIIENDKEFVVEAMMAGVKKEDISVEVEKNKLRIKAERKEVKDQKYNRKESFTGIYRRSIIMPDNADVDNITATMTDGVLTVTIPKLATEPTPVKKQIEIK
jgi:HSP20 family protein